MSTFKYFTKIDVKQVEEYCQSAVSATQNEDDWIEAYVALIWACTDNSLAHACVATLAALAGEMAGIGEDLATYMLVIKFGLTVDSDN